LNDANRYGIYASSGFLKTYRTGGWTSAKNKYPNISDIQFQHDNQIFYGALTSSAHNRARRHLQNGSVTMDGLKVWCKLRSQFNGENNVVTNDAVP
jgi:hypothetical protein